MDRGGGGQAAPRRRASPPGRPPRPPAGGGLRAHGTRNNSSGGGPPPRPFDRRGRNPSLLRRTSRWLATARSTSSSDRRTRAAAAAAALVAIGAAVLLLFAFFAPSRAGGEGRGASSSNGSTPSTPTTARRGPKDRAVRLREARPEMLGYYFRDVSASSHVGVQRLPRLDLRQRRKSVEAPGTGTAGQNLLKRSKEYWHGMADPIEEGDCVVQHEWQKTTFPSCNALHEFDLTYLPSREDDRAASVKILGNGYWRDVWRVREYDGTPLVLKTIRYEHDFEERNYERHRRDAVAMERLSPSPNVVDIYGFCGNSGLFEYGPGGDIERSVRRGEMGGLTKVERLTVAYQVSLGLADLHNFSGEGRASIAHTDVTPGQFILIDGAYKLNDFNRCRFINWNEAKNEPCGFEVGNNPGKFRSPEEYAYLPESEKVDVYSMGNVFYTLLTLEWPFAEYSEDRAQRHVARGDRPALSDELFNSTDPSDVAFVRAMEMCYEQLPEKRASAREVATFLDGALEAIHAAEKAAKEE